MARIDAAGGSADYVADRADVGQQLAALAQPGDRIVVMGARDDTLIDFAENLLKRIAQEDRG